MKLLVIGNCQARPISTMLAVGMAEVQALDPIILHLSGDQDAENHELAMNQADIILAQNTLENFKPVHLASAKIKGRFGEKTIVWPNIFYAGQHPHLRYVSHSKSGRILGPFDLYHDLRILNAWLTRREIGFTFEMFDARTVHATSIKELRDREMKCDVNISDVIVDLHEETPLFFSFNHPMRVLLIELCNRLALLLGKKFSPERLPLTEPLGRYVVPSLWHEPDVTQAELQGAQIDFSNQTIVKPGPPRRYTYEEAHETCFQCYDYQAEKLADPASLRLTPNFVGLAGSCHGQ